MSISKDDFIEFLKINNSINNIKKKNNTYSINHSNYLSISSLKNYLYKTFNLIIDDNVIKLVLDELAQELSVKEKDIRNKLAKQLNGQIEIITPSGNIDVMTDDEIIEVKEAISWKHAIGQIMSYSVHYPNKQKRIHLYGKFTKGNFDQCLSICQNNKIILTYESLI